MKEIDEEILQDFLITATSNISNATKLPSFMNKDEVNKFIETLNIYPFGAKLAARMHISEYSDSNAGVQPDTFAMRFSRL